MAVPGAQTLLRVIGLFIWALVGAETFVRQDPPPSPPPPAWVEPVTLAVAVLAFLGFGLAFWRNTRQAPGVASRERVTLLGLQIVLALLFSTDLLLLVAAELPLVLPPRPAFTWMAIQAAVTTGTAVLFSGSNNFYLLPGISHLPRPAAVALTIVGVLGWQAFAFGGGLMAATEARRRGELARVNAELRATQGLLADSSRLAERVQIARELHDSLGHHLTVLNVNLELAKQLAEGKAAEAVREAQGVTRLLLADVRAVVSSLREEREPDLRAALATLVAGTLEPRVHLTVPEELRIEDPAQAHAFFRCAQEAITNAVRHARARNLWIELAKEDGGIVLRARDDGRGTARITPGNGLAGMRERIEEAGGRVELASAPGEGFTVAAWVPAGGAA